MKKTLSIVLCIILVLFTAGCAPNQHSQTKNSSDKVKGNSHLGGGLLGGPKLLSVNLTVTYNPDTVKEDEKFGAALLNMSQEEFEETGFTLGDSCDITFGNGYALTDVPYYNGYYVKNGDPVIVAYPGNPYVSITLNNVGIWEKAGLKEGDSVTITLNEAGKYSAIQEALGQVYSFNRADYPSDEAFSNFRPMSGGQLKENFLYRGASPVDNSRNRAPYTDGLLAKNGIKFVIDLADSQEDMQAYIGAAGFTSNYVKGLYDEGKTALLDMGSAYTSQAYQQKVVAGLRAALASEGPVYIHCMEGKDRTGFVCFVLEALAGASYEEMLYDYMLTYKNYYKVSKLTAPEKYNAIADLYFVPFAEYLHGTTDIGKLLTADYSDDAAAYLKAGGMSDAEVQALKDFITE